MNDEQAWQDWVDEHGQKLVLYARQWASKQAQAEDLVQEAFVRFWATRGRVRDPLAYLYQCVRRAAIDAARSSKSRSQREQHAAWQRPSEAMFNDTLQESERQRQIQEAIATLSADKAEVVILKIWSKLTLAQIAEVTGASPGTVASRYRNAIQRLRELLKETHAP